MKNVILFLIGLAFWCVANCPFCGSSLIGFPLKHDYNRLGQPMELYHCNSCGASFWQIDQESGQINGGGVDLSNGSAPNIVNGIQ